MASVGDHLGELAQGAMLEHPHGALAAAEDRTDLARREPVDEAQHDDLAAVVGKLVERAAQPAGLLREAEQPGRIGMGERLGDGVERGRARWRCRERSALASWLCAIRKSQARNVAPSSR